MQHWKVLLMACFFPAIPLQAQHKTVRKKKPNVTKTIDSIAVKRLTPTMQWGATDIVTQQQMNKGLVTNSLNALSGQAAGVNIATGEDRMAQLNSVRVRGTTSLTGGNNPLVIIDGMYSDLATLATIYPADIERFAILKNATETSKYGSRGASGVIEVTTKKGSNSPFRLSYDGTIGFETSHKTIPMLSAGDYVATANALHLPVVNGGYDTNFQKALLRTGFVQNHHVAFSGGNEQSNYRASIGVMEHKMVVKVNATKNFTAKFDLFQKAFNNLLNIEFGVFGSSQKNHFILDPQKLFYSAAAQNPTFPDHQNAQGGWDRNATASQLTSPLAVLLEQYDNKALNFNTHMGLDFNLTPTLQAKAFGSYSFSSMEDAIFHPTFIWAQGQANRLEHKSEEWVGNATLTYRRQWQAHDLKLTAMAEYLKERHERFWTMVKGFTNNHFGYYNLAAGSLRPYGGTGSDFNDPTQVSVLGSAVYSLLQRYTLEANLRADGSSLFGQHNKWGLFPSVSTTWNVDKEPFFATLFPTLSLWKMRMGYGTSGNQASIESYYSLNLVRPTGIISYQGLPKTVLGLYRNTNPDLKWETRSTFNMGMDMGFWMNRLIVKAEFYYSTTRNMLYLYDVPVPPFTFDKFLANLGKIRNSGFEFGLGITPIQKKDLELNINMNIAFQHNRLLALSGNYKGRMLSAADITPIGKLNGAGFHGGDNNIVYQIVGQPLGVFYLPHCKGLVQNADGSYRYDIEDLDHNGTINLEDGGDRYIAGQAMPKCTMGSNISLRFKNLDISLQINGAFGHKIYNGTALTYMNMTSFPDYNVMAKAPAQNIHDQIATDYWLERGDYLNLDYITVGWNIPIRSKVISALRVACAINNLATLTAYHGLTPMINNYVVDGTLGIDDKRSYPPYRSYSLGISIQF
ncbi:SusC/RagA family TonB-linked outer membrane protein [Segatella oulorum]|uniref:SusC/RagA family TonB-linked outer membrane protein n=1 Tax=Segatella oulorum TaxID=28136 RepID=UPI0023F58A23|nr:SusC/RagA family TonB-linked outer membrane protein [Segatella oulorum]